MAEKAYRIKPLEWEQRGSPTPHWPDMYEARVPGGKYSIQQLPSGEWWVTWEMGFVEDGEMACVSLEDGKAKADTHWRDRLAAFLEEVEG